MEQLGKVLEWHDDKGYGFIAALDEANPTQHAFFHIRDYERSGRRPEVNELVRFVPSQQDEGRTRAHSVRRAVRTSRPTSHSRKNVRVTPAREISTTAALFLIAAYAIGIAGAVRADRLPIVITFVLASASAVAYMAYALDKHAAEHGRWRIPESTLHSLEMLGGWPGALLAQRVMRHKTRKASYRAGFWMSVIVNCGALAGWAFWDQIRNALGL
jgi:uncharacterized membrane protein YsdA (DUF1294 family)/cold shock CspA family protein